MLAYIFEIGKRSQEMLTRVSDFYSLAKILLQSFDVFTLLGRALFLSVRFCVQKSLSRLANLRAYLFNNFIFIGVVPRHITSP